jgi:hypothetical protein
VGLGLEGLGVDVVWALGFSRGGIEFERSASKFDLRWVLWSKIRHITFWVGLGSRVKASTAAAIYEACDGAEFERSASKFDLR